MSSSASQYVFEVAVSADRGLVSDVLAACVDGWLWYLVRNMIAASHEAVLQSVVDALPREIGKLEDTDAVLQKLLTNDTDLERPLRDLGLLPRLAVFDLDRHFVVGRFQLQRPDGLGHAPFRELDGAGKLHGDDHAFDFPKVFSEHLSKRIAEYIPKK